MTHSQNMCSRLKQETTMTMAMAPGSDAQQTALKKLKNVPSSSTIDAGAELAV